MPAIFPTSTVGAGAINSNLVSGSAFEIARGRQLLSCGVTSAAAGQQGSITSGGDVILEESEFPIATRYPIVPDEMYFNDIMEPGDRLRIAVRNTSGAGVISRAAALLSPV